MEPLHCNAIGLEQISAKKIEVVSDQPNSFHYNNENPDSFVLDIESFSHMDRNITSNSRTTLQKSLSRKGSQRGVAEKKPNFNGTSNEKDTIDTSPRGAGAVVRTGTPESPVAAVGSTDRLSSHPQAHNQITITTGNTSNNNILENKCGFRRNSFRRSPSSSSWIIEPRKVLFFFATLSSMGTILLIYFTLSISQT